MSTRSCAVHVTIFTNGSIVPTGFKFTELHGLTLAARSYALLCQIIRATRHAGAGIVSNTRNYCGTRDRKSHPKIHSITTRNFFAAS